MSDGGGVPADSVRRLYDEHPYPDHGVVGSTIARMASTAVDPSASLRILDAGCGTGEQTLGLARAFPRAEVVGADVNPRSLERARHHGLRHGIDVRFVPLDLLAEPPSDLGRFDLITSVGVLHHLADPAVGLTSLRALAAPGGRLLGMVYGRYGKMAMFAERDALTRVAGSDGHARLDAAEARTLPLAERLVTAAADILRRRRFGPALPVAELLRRARVGRSRTFTADSYAHPQEAAFSWSEVVDLLAATGWSWDGWPPRSGMPDRASQVFHAGPLTDELEQASRLEQANVYERLVRPSNLYFLARPA